MIRMDIVIPSAGRADDLRRLLHSLKTYCSPSMAQIVASVTVSDDRHSPALGLQLRAEFPEVNYVAGPARGPAANRNHGASLGGADWILFLDDDCYLNGDLLQAYACSLAARPDATVVEGAIHAVGARPNGNHHAPLNTSGGLLWSCNFLVKRSVFDTVGRFDEQFPFACLEDADLRERLGKRGVLMIFAAEAAVVHPWRSISEREVSRQIISHAIYAQKHPSFIRAWTLGHLLRAIRGRVRQYRAGRFSSIPFGKYRVVGYDLIAPVLVYGVVRIAPLRQRVCNRHRNRSFEAT